MLILGKKLHMTQIWKDEKVIPVTVISVPPNTVTIIRTKAKDGYDAVQLQLGRTKREARGMGDVKKGDTVNVSMFQEGDTVRIAGTTKGRGFQGTVKRHGFGGGPRTHGQKNRFRAPGSIGSTAPQRVVPGRRMAGHMGSERVTIKNLKVVAVDAEKNTLMLRGAVPGFRTGVLEIMK
ncbi:MAG: hypothetical protein RL681_460 [Candidatus Parcubacteria bacterium]